MGRTILVFPKSGTRRQDAASADSSGWTTFSQGGSDRIVYVDSAAANDSGNGLTPGTAKKTIAAGKALLRNGFADWMLLKCGGVWDEQLGDWGGISGRSPAQRMLVAAYGTGARPLLRTGTSNCTWLFSSAGNYIAFTDLHFWAHTFTGVGAPVGIYWLTESDSFLVEGCRFEGYSNNIVVQADAGKRHTNVTIRRNVIIDAKCDDDHAQGLYVDKTDGMVIEENVFDNNGWNTDRPGTIFAHNGYVQNGCTGIIFRKNIVANTDGMQMRSGGVMDDNLFLHTCVAMVFGGGSEPDSDPNGVSGSVSRNVCLDGNNFNVTDTRGWGIATSNIVSATFADNIFANNTSGTGPRNMSFEAAGWPTNTRGVHNITMSRNIYYNYGGSAMFYPAAAEVTGIVLDSNDFQDTGTSNAIINHDVSNTSGVTGTNNRFFSGRAAGQWFSINGVDKTLAQWKTACSDTTSTSTQVSYPDPSRSAGSYNATLGGTATLAAFLVEARLQSKQNWRSAYTAGPVIAYVRAGFGL